MIMNPYSYIRTPNSWHINWWEVRVEEKVNKKTVLRSIGLIRDRSVVEMDFMIDMLNTAFNKGAAENQALVDEEAKKAADIESKKVENAA